MDWATKGSLDWCLIPDPLRNIQFLMLSGPTHPTPSAPSRVPESEAALEDLGQAVLKDDQNLMFWSQGSEAMARAAQSLQTLWRSLAPDVAVAHFTGEQRLTLLSHINQGIAQLGLAQAMQMPSAPSLPSQIAIITHAEQLPASDVQMLQDMTRHLPGLRWRWVLLCVGNPGEPSSSAVASMTPTRPRWRSEPAPVTSTESFATVVLAPAPVSVLSEGQLSARPAARQPSRHLKGLGLATVLGLGVWGTWLHFSDQVTAPLSTRARSGATPQNPPTLLAPTRQPSLSSVGPTSLDQAEDLPASSDTTRTAPQSQATAPAATGADVPDVALRGARWLAQQTPDFYVLEHGTFATAAQAQSLIRVREELTNARVIMVKRAPSNGGRFRVISGPFRSPERAQNYKVRQNLPPQVAVRSVSSILDETITSP